MLDVMAESLRHTQSANVHVGTWYSAVLHEGMSAARHMACSSDTALGAKPSHCLYGILIQKAHGSVLPCSKAMCM